MVTFHSVILTWTRFTEPFTGRGRELHFAWIVHIAALTDIQLRSEDGLKPFVSRVSVAVVI
jgi:hypothetical protein